MFYIIIFTVLASLISIFLFIKSLKQGLFENIEETKFQVFRDEKETKE